jgi:hypothetical protein
MSKAFWADYRENFGINRPTQELISNGLYVPGTNVNNGTMAGPGNLQNAINVGTGPGGGDTIDFGAPVPVDYHQTAQGPASHAHGMEYNSQVIQTLILSTEAKIVNNTMFSYTKRDTFNSDGYSEIIDPAWFIDNRTEFIVTKPFVTINTGVEEKYQSTRAYDDFFFEPVNVWDLSNPSLRGDINSYLSSAGGGGFLGMPVPGFENRYATPALLTFDGFGKTGGSSTATMTQRLGPGDVVSPISRQPGSSTTTGTGHRRPHGRDARADPDPFNPGASASLEVGEPNANVSLVDKLSPMIRPTRPTTTARTIPATWRTAAASAFMPTPTAIPRSPLSLLGAKPAVRVGREVPAR